MRENALEIKSLKIHNFGTLSEIEIAKICTPLARESDFEVKTVKASGTRDVFGGAKCFSCSRHTDFDLLQNTWQV